MESGVIKWIKIADFKTTYKIRPKYEIYYNSDLSKSLMFKEDHCYSIIEKHDKYPFLPEDGEVVCFPKQTEIKNVIDWFMEDITMRNQTVISWNEEKETI